MSTATAPRGRVEVVMDEADRILPSGGWRSLGDFSRTVFLGTKPGNPDERAAKRLHDWEDLARRAAGLNESIDPEGGALVPPALSKQVWSRAGDFELLTNRFLMIPVAGNSLTIPCVAERSRATGSRNGGLRARWTNEGVTTTASNPTLRSLELKLRRLTLSVPITDELLEDSAGGVEALLDALAPEEFAAQINDAVVNGSGQTLLGLLASPACITVAAEGGQSAATITSGNIEAVWARCYGPSRAKAIWLTNADTAIQLGTLKYLDTAGTASGQAVYSPPANGSAYGTIKGRPVVLCENCPTLGTKGDLILWDPSSNVGIHRAAKREISTHARFDFGESVYKYSVRLDVQSYWDQPLTPFAGTVTTSPVVAVATRA